MEKEKQLHIRVTEDFRDYIRNAASYHDDSITDFVMKQCMNEEYVVVEWKNVKEVLNLVGNIANNMNQIARVLNQAKKEKGFMTEEEVDRVERRFDEMSNIIAKSIREPARDAVRKMYEIARTVKVREIGDGSSAGEDGVVWESNLDGDD